MNFRTLFFKKILVFILIFSQNNFTNAQFNETIRTGRPGQAIGPFAVGKNVFQIQAGFDFGGEKANSYNYSSNYIAPNAVFRYGLSKHLEINSAWEVRNDRTKSFSPYESNTRGLSLSTIGTRFNIFDGKNNSPALGLQVSFKLPVQSLPYRTNNITPKILLISSKSLGKRFSILTNLGVDYNGITSTPNGVYIFNLGYSISEKWSTYLENYGSFGSGSSENKWDTGLAYLYNNNLQFDIYGGYGNNNGIKDYFVSIGFSWRTHKNSNK